MMNIPLVTWILVLFILYLVLFRRAQKFILLALVPIIVSILLKNTSLFNFISIERRNRIDIILSIVFYIILGVFIYKDYKKE